MHISPENEDPMLPDSFEVRYSAASDLALAGKLKDARICYLELLEVTASDRHRAMILNDLAMIDVIDGNLVRGRKTLDEALAAIPGFEAAALNHRLLSSHNLSRVRKKLSELPADRNGRNSDGSPLPRIAIVSFLFYWPSFGGGVMHTVELGNSLIKHGYDVRHFFPQYLPWEMGVPMAYHPLPHEAIRFEADEWNRKGIQRRMRMAVSAFAPDVVIITDAWNFKPWLAQCFSDFEYLLIVQAQETLCPLNNIRILPQLDGSFCQCPKHQLATPQECQACVQRWGHLSGGLHRADRELSETHTEEYLRALSESLSKAHAVLVMNSLVEAMMSPYCREVAVVPAAIDGSRFSWPAPEQDRPKEWEVKTALLFCGVIAEPIKGFEILRMACDDLWKRRQDFILVVTGDSQEVNSSSPYIHFAGWQSQDELPFLLQQVDICIVPSIAQESFGRVAAEAMGAGTPVIASRIGGLQFNVREELTGLLFEPGDCIELGSKIERLMDDASLRRRMGEAARRHFEEALTWDVVLPRRLFPILNKTHRRQSDV